MSDSLTSANFDETVLRGEKPALVDFWAPWCGPCKAMSPVVEALAQDMPGVMVANVNVDEEQALAQRFNILSIPTFVLFKGGQVVEQFSGSMTKEALKERVEKHV